jgi:hypothetical protein
VFPDDLSLTFILSYTKLTSVSLAPAVLYLVRFLQIVRVIAPTLGCVQCEIVRRNLLDYMCKMLRRDIPLAQNTQGIFFYLRLVSL